MINSSCYSGLAVYQIITPNECRYFGVSSYFNSRKAAHFSSLKSKRHNVRMQQVYEKYGKEAFIFQIIQKWERYTKKSYQEAIKLENDLIYFYSKNFPDRLLNVDLWKESMAKLNWKLATNRM